MVSLSTFMTLPLAVFVTGGEQSAHWDWQLTEPLDLSVRVSQLVVEYSDAQPNWDAICIQAQDLGMHLFLKDREISAGGKACADR